MKVESPQSLSELADLTPNQSQQVASDKADNVLATNDEHGVSRQDINLKTNQQAITAPTPAVELNKEQLEMMAQKLQDFVGSLNRGLEFSVDKDSGRDVIKVIDKNTGDTVRQYPSEEVLELVATLSDAAGNFVNIKA